MNRNKTILPAVILLCLVTLLGCNDNETVSVDPSEKLCNSGSGFGARIEGTPEPVEMCVPDALVSTTFGATGPDRYDITAQYRTPDGIDILIEISFLRQPLTPLDLSVNGNRAASFGDPGAVWFHYRESKRDYTYLSVAVTGDFRLSINDSGIAAAWFMNITLELEDEFGSRAGTRTISEGFISVIPIE